LSNCTTFCQALFRCFSGSQVFSDEPQPFQETRGSCPSPGHDPRPPRPRIPVTRHPICPGLVRFLRRRDSSMSVANHGWIRRFFGMPNLQLLVIGSVSTISNRPIQSGFNSPVRQRKSWRDPGAPGAPGRRLSSILDSRKVLYTGCSSPCQIHEYSDLGRRCHDRFTNRVHTTGIACPNVIPRNRVYY